MNGPLHRFFSAAHRRLDGLLRSSIAEPGPVELRPFGEFRAGILAVLKHIAMTVDLARRQWLEKSGP